MKNNLRGLSFLKCLGQERLFMFFSDMLYILKLLITLLGASDNKMFCLYLAEIVRAFIFYRAFDILFIGF